MRFISFFNHYITFIQKSSQNRNAYQHELNYWILWVVPGQLFKVQILLKKIIWQFCVFIYFLISPFVNESRKFWPQRTFWLFILIWAAQLSARSRWPGLRLPMCELPLTDHVGAMKTAASPYRISIVIMMCKCGRFVERSCQTDNIVPFP